MSSSSNHIWKECAGPGLGYWRCGISYGWNLTTCDSRYRNIAPPFASVRCWHPARAATGCGQNGGNLNQLRHKSQPCLGALSKNTYICQFAYACIQEFNNIPIADNVNKYVIYSVILPVIGCIACWLQINKTPFRSKKEAAVYFWSKVSTQAPTAYVENVFS